MGCLTPKGVWGHGVCVLGVSHDMGSPAVGCPVITQPHKVSSVAGYPREWEVLTTQVLIQVIEHPEKRHFGWIFTGPGWLQGNVCSWAESKKMVPALGLQ